MKNKSIQISDKVYELNSTDFSTIEKGKEYELSEEEAKIISELKNDFTNSIQLNKQIKFLYSVGILYF